MSVNNIVLKIDSQELDLQPDFSVRFSFVFPFPDKDSIPVMATYWFTFPATDRNNMILKHANNLYITERITSYACEIMVLGIVFNGRIYVKNAGTREYKTFAVFNDLSETLVNRQVSEVVDDNLSLGADSNAIVAAAKTMSQSLWPSSKYAFPMIKNEVFYGDINNGFLGYINNYIGGTEKYAENYINSNVVYNENVMVPMPYLHFILENMFGQIGWKPDGAMIDDNDFKKLIYFNNYHLENISSPYFVHISNIEDIRISNTGKFLIKFMYIVSDENAVYNNSTGKFLCANSGTYYYSFASWLRISNNYENDITLKLYLYNDSTYTLLKTIPIPKWVGTNEFYLEANGNMSLVSGTGYSIYYELNEPLLYAYLFDLNFQFSIVSNGLNRFTGNVSLKNHVPRMTTSSFLSELMKKFNVAIFFDFTNKIVEFEHWNNIIDSQNYIDLTDTVIKDSQDITIEDKNFDFITEWEADELIEGNFKDLSKFNSVTRVQAYADLPTPGIINQLALVTSLNKYYVTAFNYTTNALEWRESFDNFYDIKSGARDKTEVRTKLSTLFMKYATVPTPWIKQQGSSPELGLNEQGLKFLNYQGFSDGYPFACNGPFLIDGSRTEFGMFMQTNGPDGTHARYGKKLYDYLQANDIVEMDLQISPADFIKISQLFMAKKDTRKIRIGAKNYIPESFDVTVSLSKIENCKVKMV